MIFRFSRPRFPANCPLLFLITTTALIASTVSMAAQPTLTENDASQAEIKSPVVIIHGAWGGAHHWKSVAELLANDHGRDVRRAALTGLGERVHLASPEVNLQTHVSDVVNLVEFEDLRSVILVAHSYGGAVASGVVDAIPERIARVIFLDSHILDDGESYLTLHPKREAAMTKRANEAGDGWLIPVDWRNDFRDVPHPIATLVQPIKLSNPKRDGVHATYWLFADGKPVEQDERHVHYQRAISRGWRTKVLPWNHNPHRDQPAVVAKTLAQEFDQTNGQN